MLIDAYDGALFDLDGVIYLGARAVPAAPPTLTRLRERGTRVGFVTNNAGLAPDAMAARIAGFGVACEADDLATSAQAIAAEAGAQLAPGARVLVTGSDFLRDEVRRTGLTPVISADDHPEAVVLGFSPALDHSMLLEASLALQMGIPWFVSNLDVTIPGERGIGPGIGSYVGLLRAVTRREPTVVAGKPYPSLFRAALGKLGAARPIFVGDRLDTDIEGARALGLPNLWVMSGAHGKADLVAAPKERRPDAIARDVRGLLEERRVAELDGATARCGGSTARRDGAAIDLDQGDDPVAALWALATVAWAHPDADASAALDALDLP